MSKKNVKAYFVVREKNTQYVVEEQRDEEFDENMIETIYGSDTSIKLVTTDKKDAKKFAEENNVFLTEG